MKQEICSHCGSEYLVTSYTFDTLRERILKYVMMHHPKPDDMIVALAKEGFRAQDVKRESTRLWDEGKLKLTPEKSWVSTVIVS
jgi:hypothetical protein